MKITVLGCGPSYGMPSLTRGFGDCDPNNPKNIRTRSSVLIQSKKLNLLIDTSPDIKKQLMRQGAPHLNALLYTHIHYDHCGGAEDVHKFISDKNEILDVYATQKDIKILLDKFDYVFKNGQNFRFHPIKMYHPFQIGHLCITPVYQKHGKGTSVGYRIGDFAYSTDVKSMTDKGWDVLAGIHTWLLGCPSPKENKKHVHLAEAITWIQKLSVKRAYLTHLGAHMDYDSLIQQLPKHIHPTFDGLTIIEKD